MTDNSSERERLRQLEIDLERVQSWVKNCDQKASIILATIGIFAGLFFSTDSVSNRILNLPKNILISFQNSDCLRLILNSLILFLFLVTVVLIFASIFYLLKSVWSDVNPKEYKDIKPNNNSRTFFGDIAIMKFQKFKDERKIATTDERIDEMISQLYINSQICSKKFENYNNGLMLFKYCIILICLDIILLI